MSDKKMNFKRLVEKTARQSGTTITAATPVVRAALNVMAESVVKGDGFSVTGFGSMRAVERAPRTVRNPSTGGTLELEARKDVSFKPATRLRSMVRGEIEAKDSSDYVTKADRNA